MSPPLVLWFALWLLSFVTLVRSQSPVQTFFPASIPLANKGPYLSAWYSTPNGSQPLSHSWPLFWDQNSILGWAGKIRVDGMTYNWMGADIGPPQNANVTNVQITPTRSIFTMQAGIMNVTVTYLSPIEPSDWVLQSLPFSYVSVEANSLDGQEHDVQVYSDISAEWLSGDRSSEVTWSQSQSGGSTYHEIQLTSPEPGVELQDQQAQDGVAYYAMANRPGLSWQIDLDSVCRGQFSDKGILTNLASTPTNAPIAPKFSVYAIAVDLGQIQRTSGPVTWAVGYVRNPTITYTAPDFSIRQLHPYYVTKYGTNIMSAIDDFTGGYGNALQRAEAFDAAVLANASAISPHYADLVSLAARQTLSALDITVSMGSDGNPNASDVRIFVKDIGSGSSTSRVSPVERIYAALPSLLYVNASLMGPILAPLLDAQDAQGVMPYAVQDLGTAYPNATGPHGAHLQGVEQTGNMLIMMYAHAQFTGDGSLLHRHYNLTKRWADYLVGNALTPTDQRSADNEGTANMTNLAIKGIIGVKAMAAISRAVGEDFDSQQYDGHASALYGQWQSLSLSSDQQHLLGVYGNQNTWALMYNVFADRLLGTNLVDQSILQKQTAFYKSLLTSVPQFGLNLDSTSVATSVAWLLFTAGIVQDNGVRDNLIDSAWRRASSNLTKGALPDQYNVQTGAIIEGQAGPSVGGVFSLLALNLPVKEITGPSASPNATDTGGGGHSSSHIGAVVGGVVAGVAVVAFVAIGVFFFLRRRRRNNPPEAEKADVSREPHRPTLAPYTYSQGDTRTASYDAAGLETGNYGRANASGPLDLIGSHTSLVAPLPTDRASPSTQSSKLRERERELSARLAAYSGSVSGSSTAGSQSVSHTGTASSREPLSPGESRSTRSGTRTAGSSSLSPTDVVGLREEVENLRRVMQEIRAERLEPPPEYTG
ncbi:DUF1793-domain-containing protein [Trametes polyzona]|nr:DUF1793-domain-containing protein [Trametes polyzona]